MKTFNTYFSGGELFGVGAVAAGYKHLVGVEYDNDIAEVARANGFNIITADVRTIDPAQLPYATHFHASPSCVRASGANTSAELNEDGTKETQEDIDSGEAVCRYLRHHKPETFSLENVYAYRTFKAFQNIIKCLGALGYFYAFENVNSADFGVPQTRRRLILRASRVSMLRELEPTHSETGANGLPKWIGWYEAIEDLLDTLPESKFADWQLARLPNNFIIGNGTRCEPTETITGNSNQMGVKAFITNRQNAERGEGIWKDEQPSPTIRHRLDHYRAFLVPGGNATSFSIRNGDEPTRTLGDTERVGNVSRAFVIGSAISAPVSVEQEPIDTISADNGSRYRAWLSQGRVVSMTPRALARFQSLPDTYILPEKKSLACKIIGNGVPSLLAQRIMESYE